LKDDRGEEMSNITPNKFQRFFIKRLGIDKYVEEYEQNKDKYTNLEVDSETDYFLRENKMWYKGNAQDLEYFYKSNYGPNIIHQYKFWQMVNTTMPRLHYPLASTISEAMGNLLFNNETAITIDSGSKARDKKYQARVDEITELNEIQTILQEGARLQSYSGGVGLKLNFDSKIADAPLITTYAKEDFNVERKFGQIVYIDFYDHYEDNYKLASRYGRGYIHYKLFKGKDQVPLNSIEETEKLKDMAFFDKEGLIVNTLFATAITNKTKEGESDYSTLHDTFHAVDEVYSTFVTYIRRTKPNVFITEDLARKDKNGDAMPLNEFDNIITILDEASMGEDGRRNSKIERSIHEIKIQGYKDSMDKLRNTVLEKVGLSPSTIGINSGGSNESADALRVRERASIKTRSQKLEQWRESLKEFFSAVFIFDQLMNNGDEVSKGIVVTDKIELNFGIKVDFGEYIQENLKERSTVYRELLKDGVISTSFAITQIFGNKLTEDEMLRLTIETKQENGKTLTPEEEA
jgi:hypothetical protein